MLDTLMVLSTERFFKDKWMVAADIRSAQRKNKSMHEVKDLLPKNPYSNFGIHTNQSPPYALEQNSRFQNPDHLGRGKPVHSLFDEVHQPDRYDHHKILAGKIIESQPVTKGHHSRTKSSITEMYQKGLDQTDHHGRSTNDLVFGRAETSTNKHAMLKHNLHHEHRATRDLVVDLEDDPRFTREVKSANYHHEPTGYRRPSLVKEGIALDDFLHRNKGFGNDRLNADEQFYRKTPIGRYDQEESPRGLKISMDKSANNDTIEEIVSPKGDFLSKIDNYIGYFKKSEITQRKMSKGQVEYFTEDEETYNEDVAQDEIKTIKKNVDGLNSKVKKVLKTNQKLVREFGDMLAREGEYTQRLGGLEDEFTMLKSVNKKYRDRLKETTHLLERERMDNQNNLLALKKVLSKGINMALENKIRNYMDHQKNLTHKRKEDRQQREDWKDRKSTDKRQSQRREDSSYVQKASMYSNDEPVYIEKRTERGLRDDEEDGAIDTQEMDEVERYTQSIEHRLNDRREDEYRPHHHQHHPHKSKESSREQQIRAIQEKLSYLIDDQGTKPKHSHQQDKLLNQVWPRGLSSGITNMKQSRTKHTDKHSIDINDQNYGYGSVNRDKAVHRPKINTFFVKHE